MSIKLAMELPTSKLQEWSPLADLDFVLAHKVLEDKEYAEFFKHRPEHRELILDNAYHELGNPLPCSDLAEAALRCRADYIITPDRVGDVRYNIEQFKLAQKQLAGWKLAVVMTGRDYNGSFLEWENFLIEVRDADMLCCTFKSPDRHFRYRVSKTAKRWKRVHLLGVSELGELALWKTTARAQGSVWSVDTGKPLKHAMLGNQLNLLPSLRLSQATTESGGPSIASQNVLNLRAEDISKEQEELFKLNVQILRDWL